MADRAASVLARLRNQANRSDRPFQLCLQLFCQEEFLRRLAASEYKDRFVLKGGHLIYCLTEFSSRPTVDLDFLARDVLNTIEVLENVLKDIINTPTGNDFIAYEIKHIAEISVDKKYPGLSALLQARIKNTKTPMRIDFGFGDIVYPAEQLNMVPTQLDDFVAPLINSYSLEGVIAEKLDAILNLMEFSSRMKDYYDLYFLSKEFNFDGEQVRIALIKTFNNRRRKYIKDDLGRVFSFAQNQDMNRKWDAFIKKLKLPPVQFDQVIAGIATFIEPAWNSIYSGDIFWFHWYAGEGKWIEIIKSDKKALNSD